MHSTFRTRGATLAGALVLALAALTPSVAEAKPEPGAKRGFRLFARPLGAMTINRVLCGLASTGTICVDSLNSSTVGGGFWPIGTADQYVFNTGLQVAGIISLADGGPWAGDTTGGFFFDPKGNTEHGLEVRPIHNSTSPDDVDIWPDAARVPCNQMATVLCQNPDLGGDVGDAVADIYDPLLQGRVAASQGDVWFMSWEADPALNAGRPHPLGVAVETRGLGWNFPSGNEDIVYFVYTFYNVTCADQAEGAVCFPTVRRSMRLILNEQAILFQSLNNARFNLVPGLPAGGYTIDPLYAAFGTDMDVTTDARSNYASVNLPFALGDTYHESFPQPSAWTFDPAIFSAPFFAGSGFVGVKYLQSPTGPGEIQLYSNTSNGGDFTDAQNTTQLFRYLSGNISVAAGDEQCNQGDPQVSRVCFINNADSDDMRFFMSSTPLALPPGAFGSLVVAYIFAAPVAGVVPVGTSVPPGNVLAINDPNMAGNPALIPDQQKMAGYLGWSDLNGDNVVDQAEFTVVPGSLLGKALVAQAVFDVKFLLPFAPEPPDFFLIPGDNEVTVMWQQSPSEETFPGAEGDPFFAIAREVFSPDGSPNALYDPNYRQFDVEGYRVYRGRTNSPNELTLLGQFDWAGRFLEDFGGQVDFDLNCAPELGVVTSCPRYNPADFPAGGGVPRTISDTVFLNHTITQVKFGERVLLATGAALVLAGDTAVVGGGGSCAPNLCPPLSDNGVPFLLVDNNVRNNFRYFYAVTAFDINSWQSGPSNIESPRIAKSVVPTRLATNYSIDAEITQKQLLGRGVVLDHTAPEQTIDPATGRFSGPAPPSNAWDVGLAAFVGQVLEGSGSLAVSLDSLVLGSPYDSPAVPHQYWFGAAAGGTSVSFVISITQPTEVGLVLGGPAATAPVGAPISNDLAERYGGDGTYLIPGSVSIKMEGPDYHSLYGRGCVNGRDGFTNTAGAVDARECAYNGSRWFDGPSPANNEVMDNPIGANVGNLSGDVMTNLSNAGQLTGVSLIHNTQSYQSVGGGEFRPMEGIKSGARRAADFNVHWGTGGTIDSIIDITHNVPVPFAADHLAGTWGILNPNAALPSAGSYDGRDELTNTDFHCIPPIPDYNSGSASCAGGPVYTLSRTAVPGPVVPFSTGLAAARTDPVWSDLGFGIYLSGDIFTIGLTNGVVPTDGTVWSLRTYIGAISGGVGAGGDYGPYVFNVFNGNTVFGDEVLGGAVPRSWTAVGTEAQVSFQVTQNLGSPSAEDIANVHPVPDPYYITGDFDRTPIDARIEFINLPQQAIIRIYSSSGVLVALLEHDSDQFGGSEAWDVRSRNNQVVASGVYFYHIEANDQRRVGRMTIVRFAQ